MALLTGPSEIRDQVYTILKASEDLNYPDLATGVQLWTKDPLYTVPDEVQMGGGSFPCASVVFFVPTEFVSPTIRTSNMSVGNIMQVHLALWVTISTSGSSLQAAGDQALSWRR